MTGTPQELEEKKKMLRAEFRRKYQWAEFELRRRPESQEHEQELSRGPRRKKAGVFLKER